MIQGLKICPLVLAPVVQLASAVRPFNREWGGGKYMCRQVRCKSMGGPFNCEWGRGNYKCRTVNCKKHVVHTEIPGLKIYLMVLGQRSN